MDRMVISVSRRTVSFLGVWTEQAKKRDGTISGNISNDMLLVDDIATAGTLAIGAECLRAQAASTKCDPPRGSTWHTLAKTCGTRDESPSMNLGCGKQEEAIRTDGVGPRGGGNGPREEWQW